MKNQCSDAVSDNVSNTTITDYNTETITPVIPWWVATLLSVIMSVVPQSLVTILTMITPVISWSVATLRSVIMSVIPCWVLERNASMTSSLCRGRDSINVTSGTAAVCQSSSWLRATATESYSDNISCSNTRQPTHLIQTHQGPASCVYILNKLAQYRTDGWLFASKVSANFKVTWHKN